MKISIITPCFNSAGTIRQTIASVKMQTHLDIEHIFVDGGSTDKTVDIIKSNSPSSKYISEKDRGIYDAMNKGVNMSSGDIIGILNSDDYYANSTVLEKVAQVFAQKNIDFYCANISFFDSRGQYSHNFGKEPTFHNNKLEMTLAHPALFFKRTVWKAVGEFDLEYSISSDYDWCLRLLQKNLSYFYENMNIVHMSLGGASSKYNSKKFTENLRIKSKYVPKEKTAHYIWYQWSKLKDMAKNGLKKMGLERSLSFLRFLLKKRSHKND